MSSFLHGPSSSKPSPPSRSPRNCSKPRKSNEARRRATFRIAALELVDFFLKRRDAFLQMGFTLREGLDLARFNLAFQVHRTELGDFTIEYTNLFARLPIQGPVGGVHHHGGVRNNVGTIVNKAIQIIALAHISEEVFLRPSRKHGRAQPRRRGFVISGKHCGLMTTLG